MSYRPLIEQIGLISHISNLMQSILKKRGKNNQICRELVSVHGWNLINHNFSVFLKEMSFEVAIEETDTKQS